MAWQAANTILGDAATFAADSAEYFAHIHLAQVYATLASVPSDVLTGIRLAQAEHHIRTIGLQDEAEQAVSEQLNADTVGPATSGNTDNSNVFPLNNNNNH